jgi:hypothetical protein
MFLELFEINVYYRHFDIFKEFKTNQVACYNRILKDNNLPLL